MDAKKFTRKFCLALVLASMALRLFSACSSQEDAAELAVVGPHTITDKQFRNRLVDFLYTVGMDDNARLRDQILNNMVNEYLISDYADEKGIGETEEFKQSFEYRRKYAIVKAWREHSVENIDEITDDELRDTFGLMNTTLRARHLFAVTRSEADSLYQLLQNGADFEQVAMQHFADPVLAANGGDIGNFVAGQMDPAFEDAAYALKVGEISPPVQTEDGYSIIKLENRITRPIVTETEYANKKHFVRRFLKWKKKELAKRAYLNSVLEKNPIQFHNAGLEAVLEVLQKQTITDSDNELGELSLFEYKPDMLSEPCLQTSKLNWTVADVLVQLGQIKNKQAKLIHDSRGLQLVLRGLVARSVFYDEAVKAGFDKNSSVINSIASAKRLHKTRFVQQAIHDTLAISNSEREDEYQKYGDQYYTAEMVKVQVLLTNDSTRALRIKQQRKPFGDLVKQYSMRPDRENSNGVLDWYNRGVFGEVADPIFALKPGEISMPLRKDGIFYLVKMLEKQPKVQLSFEEAKERIDAKLLPEKQIRVFRKFIDTLRNEKPVEIDRTLLSELNLIET
ncbi:MAG: peptidylprolyl isomerase [Calditrichota bacterium]